jgi:hypothetical protein
MISDKKFSKLVDEPDSHFNGLLLKRPFEKIWSLKR